jgi:hypothetical protein
MSTPKKKKVGRPPKYDWSKFDWNLTVTENAKKIGCAHSNVVHHIEKLAKENDK